MKKMVIYFGLMMALATAAFAYEPTVENAKVKRNGDVVYQEKTKTYTETYVEYCIVGVDKKLKRRRFVIRKGYTVEQLVDYKYQRLESIRKSYYYSIERAKNPRVDNFTKGATKFWNCVNGTNITPEEYERDSWLMFAADMPAWAATWAPFVTEENFLTLTKEEMLVKMNAFIEACKNK